ncbi:hypothetical protein HHI36_011363 [Cryptolaemus montrouzieri]|uniref:Uncharacterized protein n=1 Tax=Cryptolaemus montrouzieri TaxID=559131 RepID=A0ABD2MLX1_9CUCU
MNDVSETEETIKWDPEDNMPMADWLQDLSEDGGITQSLEGCCILCHSCLEVCFIQLKIFIEKIWPKMNDVSETEETIKWDPEDNMPMADWLQDLSEVGLETSEENLNSWSEEI